MSARSMIIVLALETSRPDSTIVVQTSTSKRFSQKSSITCSSWCSPIWPWAVATRASGTSSRIRAAAFSIELHPVVDVEDLALAQQLAADGGDDLPVLVGADVGQHRVPLLRRGGDRRHLADAGDRHLQRARDRRRATSTARRPMVRSRFICSLCSTPKRCSSSTMISPRSLIRMSGLSSRWVPMTMSTVPSASPATTSRGLLVGLEPAQRP